MSIRDKLNSQLEFAVKAILEHLAQQGQLTNQLIWQFLTQKFPEEYNQGLFGKVPMSNQNLAFSRIIRAIRSNPHVRVVGARRNQSLAWSTEPSAPVVERTVIGKQDLLEEALVAANAGEVDIARALTKRAMAGETFLVSRDDVGRIVVIPQGSQETYVVQSKPPDIARFTAKLRRLIEPPEDQAVRDILDELKSLANRPPSGDLTIEVLKQINYMHRSIDLDRAELRNTAQWVRGCLKAVSSFFEIDYLPDWNIMPLELNPKLYRYFQEGLNGIYLGNALNYAMDIDERFSKIDRTPDVVTIPTAVPQGSPTGQVTMVDKGILNRFGDFTSSMSKAFRPPKPSKTKDLMNPRFYHPLREYKDGLIQCLNSYQRRHYEVFLLSHKQYPYPEAWTVFHTELNHYWSGGLYRFIDSFTNAAIESEIAGLRKLKRDMSQTIMALQGIQQGPQISYLKQTEESRRRP